MRVAWSLIVVISLGWALGRTARADDRSDAKAHYDKATAAYALGRYGDAAVEFEQAFALKPDPALLYNAAQSYRLAGKKERALELYRNYRRVYGHRAPHAADVDKHVAELEKVIESERSASAAESTGLAQPEGAAPAPAAAAPAVAPPPAAPAPAAAAPALLTKEAPGPAQEPERHPVYTRWWFWTGVGTVVAAAVVTGVLLSRRSPTDCGAGVDYCANLGL